MTATTFHPTPMSQSLSVSAAALRFVAAMGIAALVTLGLFFLMRALIWVETPVLEDAEPRPVIEIAMVPEEIEPAPIEPPIQADPVVIPDFVTLRPDPTAKPINPIDVGPSVPVEVDVNTDNMGQIARLPPPTSLRVAPVYPARLANRGIEGSCTLQYDILGSGRVANARAIDCDHSGFERAALAAVAQWRHAVVIGADPEAVIQSGVQTRLDFQLDP